jgi:hypothetical protein
VSFEGGHRNWRIGRLDNYAIVRLHSRPAWNLDLNLGAARIDLDLTQLTVEHLSLNTGATRARIKLGDRAKESEVEVNAGASSITISVPESAGCELRVDAPLSSKHFRGFTKVADGEYRSENYSSAEKKISVSVHAGVSSVKVERY